MCPADISARARARDADVSVRMRCAVIRRTPVVLMGARGDHGGRAGGMRLGTGGRGMLDGQERHPVNSSWFTRTASHPARPRTLHVGMHLSAILLGRRIYVVRAGGL